MLCAVSALLVDVYVDACSEGLMYCLLEHTSENTRVCVSQCRLQSIQVTQFFASDTIAHSLVILRFSLVSESMQYHAPLSHLDELRWI